MKVLHILMIAVCLNIPSAYANSEACVVDAVLIPLGKYTLMAVGAFGIVEGAYNAFGKSLVSQPVPKISNSDVLNKIFTTAVSIAEVGGGVACIMGVLE